MFGTDYVEPILRLGEMAPDPNMPKLAEDEGRLIMHIELPIRGGHVLMGTDMVESIGHELRLGNNVTINLEPDDRAETDQLYAALSKGGTDCSGMSDMFWGAYWGTCCDRYGVRWMFNCTEKS